MTEATTTQAEDSQKPDVQAWCLFLDMDNKPVDESFEVELFSHQKIDSVKQAVMKANPDLPDIPTRKLSVMRCTDETITSKFNGADAKKLEETVRQIMEKDKSFETLTGSQILNGAKFQHLFIRGPFHRSNHAGFQLNAFTVQIGGAADIVPNETTRIVSSATFTVPDRQPSGGPDFGGSENIESNMIFELADSDAEPQFLTHFKEMLRQPRLYATTTNTNLLPGLVTNFHHYYKVDCNAAENIRLAEDKEFWHLTGAFYNPTLLNCNEVKEPHVRFDLGFVEQYFKACLGPGTNGGFNTNWPCKLIVQVLSNMKHYKYTPRSDFHISVDNLPYLIVEVQSDKRCSDLFRMLLQAACVARLGNEFCHNNKDRFIVTAFYINSSGHADRYFVFVEPDGTVEPEGTVDGSIRATEVLFSRKRFNLKMGSDLFELLFELYNLPSAIHKCRQRHKDSKSRIDKFTQSINSCYDEGFTTKKTGNEPTEKEERPPKRARTDMGEGHQRSVFHEAEVLSAFAKACYTLRVEPEGEDDNGGFVLLHDLRSNMRRATNSAGKAVIIKLLGPNSRELDILSYLNSLDQRYNHTIPVLQVFQLKIDTFIVLPEATPLNIALTFPDVRAVAANLCYQLIEGVAFMHWHNVAHMDLKPPNIVVSREGPTYQMDSWRGTPQWMAPEIGRREGPRHLYSPLRADLWSCGLVLKHLSAFIKAPDTKLSQLIEQLLNRDPQKRPLLHELRDITPPQNDCPKETKAKSERVGHGKVRPLRKVLSLPSRKTNRSMAIHATQ